jgi:hypothetical protein
LILKKKILNQLEKVEQPMSTDKFRVFANVMIEIARGEARNIDDLAGRIRAIDMKREIILSARNQRDKILGEFSRLEKPTFKDVLAKTKEKLVEF